MTIEPRYQATYFPGLGCTFDAVRRDGTVTTLAGISTARNWTVCDCRRYALDNGFTRETQL
jgi:hypothetical protein